MLDSDSRSEETYLEITHAVHQFNNSEYLNSNTGNIRIIHNLRSTTKLRLLVFGDSFFNALLIYLLGVFRDIIYFRSAFFHTDVIELLAPDIVFSGNTERYLSHIQPDSQGISVLFEHLNFYRNKPDQNFIDALTAQLSFHHRRNIYDKWKQDLNLNIIEIEDVCTFTINNQITVRNRSKLEFEAIDPDPQILITNLIINSPTTTYIEIQIISNVISEAKIFFIPRNSDITYFTEHSTISTNIHIGTNQLLLQTSNIDLDYGIRLDPLSNPGHFSIVSIATT